MCWQVLAVIICFLWHEVDEYRNLLPWLERNRDRLPRPAKNLRLSPFSFKVIATQELILLLLISLLFPTLWFIGTIVAYGVHLLIHCIQMIYTYYRGIGLRLWSAPTQLPILVAILIGTPNFDVMSIVIASAAMTVVLVINLAAMHLFTNIYSSKYRTLR